MIEETLDPFGESDDSFEKDSGPSATDHTSFEVRKKFFPWHKPRKQYLRVTQWRESIGKLIDTLLLKEIGQPLYYLSLPGPDLLDIRSLQPIFSQKEVKLYFVGLNGGDDDAKDAMHLNAAMLSEVRSLPGVDASSLVVPDLFEHLAKKRSIAHSRIIAARRSFDVINIDLCGSLANASSGAPGSNTIDALYHLIKHQASSRAHDWILFITTRSNRDMVDSGAMSSLLKWLNQMISDDPTLLESMVENGLIKLDAVTDGRVDESKLDAESHSNSFSLGLGHWILNSLFKNDPSWRVDMLPQYGYHVALNEKPCDMLSLGFYCKRLAQAISPDSMGLASITPLTGVDPKKIASDCSNKIFRRVSKAEDVDIFLHSNSAVYNQFLEESAQLLASARYDETEFRLFAETERLKVERFLKDNALV